MTTSTKLQVIGEAVAVLLSLAYTFLYIRFSATGGDISLVYIPAFFGSVIFMLLTWDKKIYAESALHLFYVLFAVYGYFLTSDDWRIEHTTFSEQLPFLLGGSVLVALLGYVLKSRTDAATPYLDAFTTVFSLIATWLMLTYIHENWIYWIVIDFVAIFLYAFRKMYLASLLFVLYLIMAIDGYFDSISIFY